MFDIKELYIPVRERIFTQLRAKAISQKEFAKAIGAHPTTITDWKKGKSYSFVKMLPVIAEALDTTVDWLLTGDGPGPGDAPFRVVWTDQHGCRMERGFDDPEAARKEAAMRREVYDGVKILEGPAEDETTLGKMAKALQVELKQSQLDALDRLLGGLVTRCEAEAAALAPLGERGRKLAEQRLRDAEEAEALWDFFLHV